MTITTILMLTVTKSFGNEIEVVDPNSNYEINIHESAYLKDVYTISDLIIIVA